MRRRYGFLAPLAAVLLLIPLFLALSAGAIGGRADAEMLTVAQRAITRAAVQCYALEGFYPPNLDYLTEHYGVIINEDAIFVDYIYIGSNILPDITVLPVSPA